MILAWRHVRTSPCAACARRAAYSFQLSHASSCFIKLELEARIRTALLQMMVVRLLLFQIACSSSTWLTNFVFLWAQMIPSRDTWLSCLLRKSLGDPFESPKKGKVLVASAKFSWGNSCQRLPCILQLNNGQFFAWVPLLCIPLRESNSSESYSESFSAAAWGVLVSRLSESSREPKSDWHLTANACEYLIVFYKEENDDIISAWYQHLLKLVQTQRSYKLR